MNLRFSNPLSGYTWFMRYRPLIRIDKIGVERGPFRCFKLVVKTPMPNVIVFGRTLTRWI